jgi:hypothetical protein
MALIVTRVGVYAYRTSIKGSDLRGKIRKLMADFLTENKKPNTSWVATGDNVSS